MLSGHPLSTRPRVSLVIAASTDAARCRAALAAVLPVCREWGVELLLVRPATVAETVPLGVTVVPAPHDASPETYPSLGLSAAGGDLVLLTTDIDAPQLDWDSILLRRLGMVAEAKPEGPVESGEAAVPAGKPVA